MPWSPVTLDHVRAVVKQARIDRAADADGDGQLDAYFQLYHDGTVAAIRAQIGKSHNLDANPTLLPPEFVLLAAMRIAGVLLGRPGATGAETVDPFGLTRSQTDELKRLETLLAAVAEGAAVTAPGTVEIDPSTVSVAASPVVTAPTRYWGRDSQDGIGAY